MKKVKLAVIGAGARGKDSYAPYVLENPEQAEFVAVIEPDEHRRKYFKKTYNIEETCCYTDWNDFFSRPKAADAVIIATQDTMHYEPAIKALEKGYHVLLEKPMATEPTHCIKLAEQSRKQNVIFSICHVLRYTDFFSKIKELLDDGAVGRLISIQHNENVGFFHYAHSYIRGNWRNSAQSSPMILAKSCHDMDIMLWLSGDTACEKVSSYGDLFYFKIENAPAGTPDRCIDGCPVEKTCPYSAPHIYLGDSIKDRTTINHFKSVVSSSTEEESIREELRKGPYGRCVFKCDNNVVDNQVVILQFENGVKATFNMCGFTETMSRTMKLMGTHGQIRASMDTNEIEISNFRSGNREVMKLSESASGHMGGDFGIMRDFIGLVAENRPENQKTSASVSLESHLMAFAAEESRKENNSVNIREYAKRFLSRCY